MMISVVIPAFKRKEGVLQLLTDLYKQDHPNFEVIVVDDNSPDGTAEAIAAQFPQTVVLRNEVNRGPAVSRNRGIRESKGEIIVGFDSDVTVPDSQLLSKVEATFAELPEADLLAFRLLRPDGESDDVERWWHPLPIEQYKEVRFQTDYFSGTGYAVRTSSAKRAGLYPEILFMHYEEVELGVRILDQGGSIVYTPDLRVLHHVGQSTVRSRVRTFYKPRNEILLGIGYFPLIRGLRFVVPRVAAAGLSSLRHDALKVFFEILFSAARLAPARFKQRKPLKASTWEKIAVRRGGDFGVPPTYELSTHLLIPARNEKVTSA